MKSIKNLILSLVVGGVVSLAATASQAAIYNYSFQTLYSNKTVSGTITLAGIDGTFAATSVTVEHADNWSGVHIFPYDFVDDSINNVRNNSFVVDVLGNITDFYFRSTDSHRHHLGMAGGFYGGRYAYLGDYYYNHFESNSNGPQFSISTVPLPAALPLYGAGIAVLGFMGWRRKQKATATV